MDLIKLEILEGSYWEHFNHAKQLALILPIDHPKRKKIEKEMGYLVIQIQDIKSSK